MERISHTGKKYIISEQFRSVVTEPVNIVVPAHNSAGWLLNTLISINDSISTLPEDTHVNMTVCANNCNDKTSDLAKEFGNSQIKSPNINFKVVEESTPGKPAAVNRGIKTLLGMNPNLTNVLQINDDVILPPTAILQLQASGENYPNLSSIHLIPVPYFVLKHEQPKNYAELLSAAWLDLTGAGTTCAVSQAWLINYDTVGKFPEKIILDDYWVTLHAINNDGWGIVQNDRDVVGTSLPQSVGALLKQVVGYKLGVYQLTGNNPEMHRKYIEARGEEVTVSKRLRDAVTSGKYSLQDYLFAGLIEATARLIAKNINRTNPPQGALTTRINS